MTVKRKGGSILERKYKGSEWINGHPIRCYADREDSGFDRWTVVYMDCPEGIKGSRLFHCVGRSGHSTAMVGKHLGKLIKFNKLPEDLQRIVRHDMAGDVANALEYCRNKDKGREHRLRFEATSKPYHAISTGVLSSCKMCQEIYDLSEAEIEAQEIPNEGSISGLPCECCGLSGQGTRYEAHALDSGDELCHLSICEDCLVYIGTELGG